MSTWDYLQIYRNEAQRPRSNWPATVCRFTVIIFELSVLVLLRHRQSAIDWQWRSCHCNYDQMPQLGYILSTVPFIRAGAKPACRGRVMGGRGGATSQVCMAGDTALLGEGDRGPLWRPATSINSIREDGSSSVGVKSNPETLSCVFFLRLFIVHGIIWLCFEIKPLYLHQDNIQGCVFKSFAHIKSLENF